MTLYLDDDTADALLVQLLRKAGHNVQIPWEVGLAGRDDPVHLRHAVRQGRVLVSRNYSHFEQLHELILEAGGHHPGIFIVRFDNDSTRDMKPRDVVRAIGKIEAAAVPVQDTYHILNHWR